MTGLEKMQSQILDEARRSADEILEQARSEAQEMKEEAGKAAQEKSSRILEKSRTEVKNIEERALSSCALQKRQVLLEAKQEIIAQILEKAYHTLVEADKDTYFGIIRKMLGKYAAGQAGEICFSKKDLDRMPDFAVAADDGIKFLRAGQLDKILAVLFQGLIGLFRRIARHARRAAHTLEGRQKALFRDVKPRKQRPRLRRRLADQAQHQVLDRNIIVTHPLGAGFRLVERVVHVARDVDLVLFARAARHLGQAVDRVLDGF